MTSLLRYGVIVTGSCLPDDLVNRLDTAVINTAARRINGLPLSTRIETLHFLSNTHSMRNMYVQHCALFVRRTLQTPNSTIEARKNREIGALLKKGDSKLEVQAMRTDREKGFIEDPAGLPADIIERTEWQSVTYTKIPEMSCILDIPSVYFAHATEIRKIAARKKKAVAFQETHSLLDVGLQVLKKAGWWPGCTRPQDLNITRLVPPDEFEAHLFLDRTYTKVDRTVEFQGNAVSTSLIEVLAGVVRVDKVVAAIAIIAANGRVLKCRGFVHGQIITEHLPVVAHEVSVQHALQALREWMRGMDHCLKQNINIQAGDASTRHQIA